MPIHLVTAANGHGKGQFMIKQILDMQKDNDNREKQGQPRRPIYTNIHGINTQGKKPLIDCLPLPDNPLIFFGKQDNPDDPPPEGYFVPPIGSIFIFDECQKFDWIQQKSGALSKDLRVKSLEEHRHAGLDLWFVTQSPNYIHSHIQGLVSPHYHLERPSKLPFTNIFRWNVFEKNPNSSSARKKADDHQTLKLGKKYGAYYQSSAEHNMKGEIPLKLKLALGFFGFIMLLLIYKSLQTKEIYEKKHSNDTTANTQDTQTQTPKDQPQQPQTQPQEEVSQLAQAQDKRALEQFNRRIYLIDTQLPKDYEVIKSEPMLQVRGVMKMGDTCKAYNTYGDLMTLSKDECDYYLKEVGRVHKSTINDTQTVTPAPEPKPMLQPLELSHENR